MGFEADEDLSQPYSVEVTLAAPSDVEVDDKSLLGQDALLTVQLGDGTARLFHGLVARVAQWDAGRAPEQQRYRITVVPRLWTRCVAHLLRHGG